MSLEFFCDLSLNERDSGLFTYGASRLSAYNQLFPQTQNILGSQLFNQQTQVQNPLGSQLFNQHYNPFSAPRLEREVTINSDTGLIVKDEIKMAPGYGYRCFGNQTINGQTQVASSVSSGITGCKDCEAIKAHAANHVPAQVEADPNGTSVKVTANVDSAASVIVARLGQINHWHLSEKSRFPDPQYSIVNRNTLPAPALGGLQRYVTVHGDDCPYVGRADLAAELRDRLDANFKRDNRAAWDAGVRVYHVLRQSAGVILTCNAHKYSRTFPGQPHIATYALGIILENTPNPECHYLQAHAGVDHSVVDHIIGRNGLAQYMIVDGRADPRRINRDLVPYGMYVTSTHLGNSMCLQVEAQEVIDQSGLTRTGNTWQLCPLRHGFDDMEATPLLARLIETIYQEARVAVRFSVNSRRQLVYHY